MIESSKARLATLGELAKVFSGYSPKPQERKQRGDFLLVGGRNIKNGHLVTTPKDSYVDNLDKGSFRRAIAQPGDVIISTLFDTRKLCIYGDADPRVVVNSSCAIIRAPGTNDYIVSYLRTFKGREQFLRDAARVTVGTARPRLGSRLHSVRTVKRHDQLVPDQELEHLIVEDVDRAVIPRLSISALSGIPVPLLPFSELQRFGDDHIESSSPSELEVLQAELRSREEEIRAMKAELAEVTSYYEDRIRKIEEQKVVNDLAELIARGETSKLEFKSTLRWNLKAKRDDPNMELAILKTIAAFCNTHGGELFIGVADDGTILGIADDHFPNDDRFLLHLRNLVMDRLVPSVVHCVDYELVTIAGVRICRVVCKRSSEDVWLKAPEVFCVRVGPSSTELPPREALRYIREHFPK